MQTSANMHPDFQGILAYSVHLLSWDRISNASCFLSVERGTCHFMRDYCRSYVHCAPQNIIYSVEDPSKNVNKACLCPNLSLVEAMPRLFVLEPCLTCYSPDLGESRREANMLCTHSKTHSWTGTRHTLLAPHRRIDIALGLLRTTHKSGLDETITTQDLKYEQWRKCLLFITAGQIHSLCVCRFRHFNAAGSLFSPLACSVLTTMT